MYDRAKAVHARKRPGAAGRVDESTLRVDAPPLTAREVAALCAVELKTVHNWVAQGLLPHFRTPGRHLRFQAAEVREFLQSCGYNTPGSSQRPRVLALAKTPRRGRLRRALSGNEVLWATDAYAALVVAGRERPVAIVLDAGAVPAGTGSAILRSLARELPAARLVWVGARPPARTKGLSVVRPNDERALAAAIPR